MIMHKYGHLRVATNQNTLGWEVGWLPCNEERSQNQLNQVDHYMKFDIIKFAAMASMATDIRHRKKLSVEVTRLQSTRVPYVTIEIIDFFIIQLLLDCL